jgi:hypothetical protein
MAATSKAGIYSACIALAVITLISFIPLMSADYTGWDDGSDVARNPYLSPPTWEGVGHYWVHSERDLYIPVTYTVWSALAAVAQPETPGGNLNPAVFHWANIVVHIAGVWVVFAIVRLLIEDTLAAAVGAAIFAVHPVQVEAVGWISGMKDLLAGALGLCAIWQYLIHAKTGKRWRYPLATVLFVLALLSKPSAVAAPVIAVGLDWILVRRPLRRVMASIAPWLVLALAAAIVGKLSQPARFHALSVPIVARPLVAMDALAFYLYRLIYPVHLGIDYGRSPGFVLWRTPYYAWWTWILPAGLAVLILVKRRKYPFLAAGGLVFIAGVLPVLGLVRFDFQVASTVADHYLYVSMLGVALAGAALFHRLARHRQTIYVAGALMVALGTCSFLQATTWTTGMTLFTNAVLVNDRSWMAYVNLAVLAKDRGDLGTCMADARKAVEAGPDQPLTYTTLGGAQEALGDWQEAEKTYRLAIERLPDDPVGYANLASLLGDRGRPGEAIKLYERALELKPDYADAKKGLRMAEEAMAASQPARR